MIDIDYYTQLLNKYELNSDYSQDEEALNVCLLALKAVEKGNIGVGALIKNEKAQIIAEGFSSIFEDGFRSDLHAEMVAMNSLESQFDRKADLCGYSLFSSLEPCPMCMTRIIFSGIGKVYYVCPDDDGGMVRRKESLPPIFQEFSKTQNQVWLPSECSSTLKQIAFDIWDQSRYLLDRHFKSVE